MRRAFTREPMLLRLYTSSTQPGSYSYFPIAVIYFYFRAYFTNHKNAKLSNLSILVCDGGKKIYQPHIKSRWLTNHRPGVEGCSALHSCNWWEAKKIATIKKTEKLIRNRARLIPIFQFWAWISVAPALQRDFSTRDNFVNRLDNVRQMFLN